MISKIKISLIGSIFIFTALTASEQTVAHEVICPEGMSPWVTFNLYFGRGHRDNPESISEEDWNKFLEEVITPRFPDGLTLIDVYGQYFDSEAQQVFSEKTKLLNVLVPHDALESGTSAVSEINRAYSERFPETGTVFVTSIPASCVEL